MRYGLLAVSAGFAWFLIVSAATSLGVAVFVRATAARPAGPLTQAGAPVWFGLRLLPSLAGLLFVLTVFSPAFGRFEPREATETPGFGLVVLAALSAGMIGWAFAKGLAGWHRAASQARGWLRRSNVLPCAETPIRIYGFPDPHPTVSLVGLWRPCLFVSRAVADVLTPDELEAVAAHEREHRSARDNMKRLALLAAPDVLRFAGAGAALEARWLSAVELEADRRAVQGNAARGLSLASALVKVARLMPAASAPSAPVSDFYTGGLLAARVESLVRPSSATPARPAHLWPKLVMALLVGCVVTSSLAQLTVHRMTEFLVNLAR